jgi:electron transport complex protein RnfE
MAETSYAQISKDGFWNNNVALVQLLGLCPLLAVTTTTVNGLGLGLATTAVLILSNVIVSAIRNVVRAEIRLPVFMMIIASAVTAIQLSMNAYFHGLYLILGIFIPLIVTNCSVIGRAEGFASKHSIPQSFVDALAMGLGFTIILVLLGAMRELIGTGAILANAQLMFGEAARGLTVTVFEDYRGFLLAILPPGAFLGLGVLIAIKNVIDARQKQKKRQTVASGETEAAEAQA